MEILSIGGVMYCLHGVTFSLLLCWLWSCEAEIGRQGR